MKAAAFGLMLAMVPGALPAQGAPAAVRPPAFDTALPPFASGETPARIALRAPIADLAFDVPDLVFPGDPSVGVVADLASTVALIDRVPLNMDVESCLQSFVPDRRERRLLDHVAPGLAGAARRYRVSLEMRF